MSFFSEVLDPTELTFSKGGVVGVRGSVSATGLVTGGGGGGNEGRGRVLLESDCDREEEEEEERREGGEEGSLRE